MSLLTNSKKIIITNSDGVNVFIEKENPVDKYISNNTNI